MQRIAMEHAAHWSPVASALSNSVSPARSDTNKHRVCAPVAGLHAEADDSHTRVQFAVRRCATMLAHDSVCAAHVQPVVFCGSRARQSCKNYLKIFLKKDARLKISYQRLEV